MIASVFPSFGITRRRGSASRPLLNHLYQVLSSDISDDGPRHAVQGDSKSSSRIRARSSLRDCWSKRKVSRRRMAAAESRPSRSHFTITRCCWAINALFSATSSPAWTLAKENVPRHKLYLRNTSTLLPDRGEETNSEPHYKDDRTSLLWLDC